MENRPRVGQRVKVRFGPYDEEGTVINVDGKGEKTWVMVELYLDDPDRSGEPTIMTYLLREVEPAQAA